MNFEEEVIRNLEKQYPEASIVIQDCVKCNTTLRGLVIRKPGAKICPTLYLNDYQRKYEEGAITAEQAAAQLACIYEESMEDIPEVPSFNKEYILSNATYHVLNRDRNPEIENSSPCTVWNDLIQVPYVSVDITGRNGCVRISKEMINTLHISESELAAACEKNAEPVVVSMFDALKGLMADNGTEEISAEDIDMLLGGGENTKMYVCSNRAKYYGAGMFLHGNVMEDIAERFGGDVIIIPSSVHECLFIPAFGSNKSDIAGMVHEVNEECVSSEDFLSDSVYVYDRENKKIMMYSREQEI